MAKIRRGMIIKNTNDRPVTIDMETRRVVLGPGEEQPITSEEVLDSELRQQLQVRAINIVRPTTEEEDQALQEKLGHAPEADS
ncbi:MAG: hypothetical protein AAGI71_13230 [Bacteroidota bacterium]